MSASSRRSLESRQAAVGPTLHSPLAGSRPIALPPDDHSRFSKADVQPEMFTALMGGKPTFEGADLQVQKSYI